MPAANGCAYAAQRRVNVNKVTARRISCKEYAGHASKTADASELAACKDTSKSTKGPGGKLCAVFYA